MEFSYDSESNFTYWKIASAKPINTNFCGSDEGANGNIDIYKSYKLSKDFVHFVFIDELTKPELKKSEPKKPEPKKLEEPKKSKPNAKLRLNFAKCTQAYPSNPYTTHMIPINGIT